MKGILLHRKHIFRPGSHFVLSWQEGYNSYYSILKRGRQKFLGLTPALFEEDSDFFSLRRGHKSYTPVAIGKLWITLGHETFFEEDSF